MKCKMCLGCLLFWVLSRDECMFSLILFFFINLLSVWRDFSLLRCINARTAAFLFCEKFLSEPNSLTLTQGALIPVCHSPGQWPCCLQYYTFKILTYVLPRGFQIVHLSYIVYYAMQSQERDFHGDNCFCLQTKLAGIVYTDGGLRVGNQLLESLLWKGTWLS